MSEPGVFSGATTCFFGLRVTRGLRVFAFVFAFAFAFVGLRARSLGFASSASAEPRRSLDS